MKRTYQKLDIYQDVTNRIINQLESGHKPWFSRWSKSPAGLPIRANGEAYQGINIVALWLSSSVSGYSSPRWLTFNQAIKEGGRVRKGEKGTRVVYWSTYNKKGANEEDEKIIPFIKTYSVFNIDQIDGLEEPVAKDLNQNTEARVPEWEAFFKSTSAVIVHKGDWAYYKKDEDTITMPRFERFVDADAYYSTLAHETCHWTGHASRLARLPEKIIRTTPEYAREELVAELGSAFLAARLGLRSEPREDHAAYLDSWLQALKSDKKAIFKAATAAQKAVDFLCAQIAQNEVL